MTAGAFFELIHNLARVCPHCGSMFVKQSLFCEVCEQALLQSKEKVQLKYISFEKRQIPAISLFDWIPDESRKLSLLVTTLKGGQPKSAFDFYAKILAEELRQYQISKAVIIPAPAKNKAEKDHACVLAESLSRELAAEQVQFANPLERLWFSKSQKELSRRERQSQMLINPENFSTNNVVIFVDDVVTTGATALAAFKALGRPKRYIVCSLAGRRHLAALAAL